MVKSIVVLLHLFIWDRRLRVAEEKGFLKKKGESLCEGSAVGKFCFNLCTPENQLIVPPPNPVQRGPLLFCF